MDVNVADQIRVIAWNIRAGVEVGSIGVSVGLGTGTVWVSSPQPTNSISAAANTSSRITLSFK